MTNFLINTQNLITEAAQKSGITPDVLANLQKPEKILEFEMSVKSQSGEKKFPGWRVQHNSSLGPYKGGIRFHPDSSLEEVKALASLMTWKTSLMGLPYGGGKGAVKINPRELDKKELEEISRAYVRAIWKEIGPDQDIPAPDVGTDSQIMDWMVDEYSKLAGRWEPAAFTGKSIERGGSQGRDMATGFGGYVILREFLKVRNIKSGNPNPSTVAIQGFGNVGAHIAKILFNEGFKICAISDSKGGLYEESGINIPKVLDIKEKTGIIDRNLCYGNDEHANGCKNFSNEELLESKVDILIPAALENQITEENADKIKARVVLEMANGPTTREAGEVLEKNGIEVIPDILANGGGVVGSYFEWLQSKDQKYWNEKEVLGKIDEKLAEAFRNVVEAKRDFSTNWRMAAYTGAIKSVADAAKIK